MKLLAWNLNHRAARRTVPDWIADAICAQRPDVLVLTEYVEGLDHARFLDALRRCGLHHSSITTAPPRQSALLIASRQPHLRSPLMVPRTSGERLVNYTDGS